MAGEMHIDSPTSHGLKRSADEADLTDRAPKRIKPLEEDVINKIAAGEIIVAPMHALKELLENAVDAGSTSVEVLVKDGGLKLLQITDNGHGIEACDDLTILCERFTTSKLKSFEDLSSMSTYGFRGEALASISHIAHLKVTTKTASSSCAWQAHYRDGKLVPSKPGKSADPAPTAGRGGTQLTVEDLFYNIPTRRRAFRSASEEYTKILDVVGRYAVHCSGISFSLKKHGESGSNLSVAAQASTIERIKQIYGSAIANELMRFETKKANWGFEAEGWATNANHHVKRTTILLFINSRSVESSVIKKAIEQTYSNFLPKGGHPFVYLSLKVEPHRVDVNVHPTKREVHFLNEDEIVEAICEDIASRLADVDTSRTFQTQTILPGARSAPKPSFADVDEDTTRSTPKTPATKKPYENNLVRTDSKLRKITSMLPSSTSPGAATSSSIDGLSYEETDNEYVQCRLTSIKTLKSEVREAMHNGLTEVFASHTYVGLVDDFRRLCAIQSGVNLYLVDYGLISNAFFYQLGLTDFGNFGRIMLDPPPLLTDLLTIGADLQKQNDSKTSNANSDPNQNQDHDDQPELQPLDYPHVIRKVASQLTDRRAMLSEYFSLNITESGHLTSLPLLLRGYTPTLAKLPTFLLRLGPFVNWTDEKECFQTFLTELASFYTPEQLPPLPPSPKGEGEVGEEHQQQQGWKDDEEDHFAARRKQMASMLEHVLFPAFRGKLVATKGMLKGVVEIANLKGLYRRHPTIIPLAPNLYARLLPALHLASRALFSRRYARFWCSLVHAASHAPHLIPKEGPWSIRLLRHDEITDKLIALTHRRFQDLARCMHRNKHPFIFRSLAHNGAKASTSDRGWSAKRRARPQISLCSETCWAFLGPEGDWEVLEERGESAFHLLNLAGMLMHEIAHAFLRVLFDEIRGEEFFPEPVLVGDDLARIVDGESGKGEVGYVADQFFFADGLERVGVTGPEWPSRACDREVAACCVDLQPAGAVVAVIEGRCRRAPEIKVGIPPAWVEAMFSERWFQEPYPRWSLSQSSFVKCKVYLDKRGRVCNQDWEWLRESFRDLMTPDDLKKVVEELENTIPDPRGRVSVTFDWLDQTGGGSTNMSVLHSKP
ncbi:MAG: hypothetical protein Q9227_008903 [Pyrenula ochraceoflavens]